jgi:AraC-like DNA-binding protein
VIDQDQVRVVNAVQDFLKANVRHQICLKDVADAVGYSPGHISRLFKAHTGLSIFEYMRSLRLSEAALHLRDKDVRVVDVAFDFLFASHEGFTRAFSKEFGIPPKQYAKETPPIRLFMPYPVRNKQNDKKDETKMDEKLKPVFVQVIERPERKVILKRGVEARDYFAYCEEVGCDVWGILCSIKDALNEPMGMWLPKNMMPKGTSEYVQGVEVPMDYVGMIPDGFEVIQMPACKMMVFQGPTYDDKDFENAIQNMWDLIKQYDPNLYGFEWADEDGPRFQFEPQGYRGYIEGRPVRFKK